MRLGTAGRAHLVRLFVDRENDPIVWLALGSGTRPEDDDATLEAPYDAHGLGPVAIVPESLGGGVYEIANTFTARDTTVPLPVTEYGLIAEDGTPISRHVLSLGGSLRAGESRTVRPQVALTPGDIPRDGLLCEYRFDEFGQVLLDHSGSHRHGQLGVARSVDPFDPTPTGAAYTFAGGEYVVLPPVALRGAFTVLLVGTRTDTTHADTVLGSSATDVRIGFAAGNVFAVQVVPTSGGGSSDTSAVADGGAGAHLYAVVRDSANVVSAAVDGGAFDTLFVGAAQAGTVVVDRVGGGTGTTSLVGSMYSLLLYDRALSLAEIEQARQHLRAALAPRLAVLP